jgi:hypothetical protein
MSDALPDLPRLIIRPEAAALIREHGGCAYVWADSAGMKHGRLRPPRGRSSQVWTELQADGLRVFVDPGISPPAKWVIVLRHLPHRHIDALYNGYTPGIVRGVMSWKLPPDLLE